MNLPAIIQNRPAAPVPALAPPVRRARFRDRRGRFAKRGDKPVLVRVRPSVFRDEFLHFELEPMLTVAELIERTEVPVPEHCGTVVWLNGQLIEESWYPLVRPKPGTIVNIAVLPHDQRTAIIIAATSGHCDHCGGCGPSGRGHGWRCRCPVRSRRRLGQHPAWRRAGA